jgi:hydrogenase expression/formation protein HypC
MCIGTPFCLSEAGEFSATGVARHEQRMLSLLLTGPLQAGDWVLAQGDLAIRVIDAREALLIANALEACAAAELGGDFEAGFADLIGREPQLPEWLRQPRATEPQSTGPVPEEAAHG